MIENLKIITGTPAECSKKLEAVLQEHPNTQILSSAITTVAAEPEEEPEATPSSSESTSSTASDKEQKKGKAKAKAKPPTILMAYTVGQVFN